DLYLGEERPATAGFADSDAKGFKGVFELYDKGGSGLKARKLWHIMGSLGFQFCSIGEQKELIQWVKEEDRDRSGSIDFQEFMHLLRRITEKSRLEGRRREHRLISESGMALEEAEEWLGVFQGAVGISSSAQGQGEASIHIQDMRELFEQIGLKWDADSARQMKAWLKEVDEDTNGRIDFGEFCSLVQRMWDSNFADIKRISAEVLAQTAVGKTLDTPRPLAAALDIRSSSKDRSCNDNNDSGHSGLLRNGHRSWVAALAEAADRALALSRHAAEGAPGGAVSLES
ncbi:unnamed protein product, partial [Polarella glacialis]